MFRTTLATGPARLFGLSLTLVVATASLAACSKDSAEGTVTVTATDSECTPDVDSVAAGVRTFQIKNSGSQVNELYILRDDQSVVSERENVAPGLSAELTVELHHEGQSAR